MNNDLGSIIDNPRRPEVVQERAPEPRLVRVRLLSTMCSTSALRTLRL